MEVIASVSLKLKKLAKDGELSHELLRKMYSNFNKILDNGHGLEGLPGKYKPSWEFDRNKASAIHKAFLEKAEKYSVHHYHVGYKVYFNGRDKNHPGDESSGLIHTSIAVTDNIQRHIIFKASEEHPSPFSFGFSPELDFAV
jgi:hypothetical protein